MSLPCKPRHWGGPHKNALFICGPCSGDYSESRNVLFQAHLRQPRVFDPHRFSKKLREAVRIKNPWLAKMQAKQHVIIYCLIFLWRLIEQPILYIHLDLIFYVPACAVTLYIHLTGTWGYNLNMRRSQYFTMVIAKIKGQRNVMVITVANSFQCTC